MSTDMAMPPPRFDQAHYAGFWVRFCAALIDLVIYSLIEAGIGVFLGMWWSVGIIIILFLVTYAWFFSSKWQASPGMWLLRFHICDVHGERISYVRGLWWGVSSLLGNAICFGPNVFVVLYFKVLDVTEFTFSCMQQQVGVEDCIAEVEKMVNVPYATYQMILMGTFVLTCFMLLIWALSIALPKDKTGFHNLICGTRFIKGRPPASGREAMPVV